MRTRPNDWIDTNTFETKYGIDVLHEGKWKHLAEDGKPCIYIRMLSVMQSGPNTGRNPCHLTLEISRRQARSDWRSA